jgi:hypothetical protein
MKRDGDKNENIEEIEYSRICSFNTEYFLCLTYSICGGMLDWHLGERPAVDGTQKPPACTGIIQ